MPTYGPNVPLDFQANMRDVGNVQQTGDPTRNTFMEMQLQPGDTGVHQNAQWEIDMENGWYIITAGVGDPTALDGVHVVRANGIEVVRWTPVAGVPQIDNNATVQVTNNKLIIDSVGGTNTKLNHVSAELFGGSFTTRALFQGGVAAFGPISGSFGMRTGLRGTAQATQNASGSFTNRTQFQGTSGTVQVTAGTMTTRSRLQGQAAYITVIRAAASVTAQARLRGTATAIKLASGAFINRIQLTGTGTGYIYVTGTLGVTTRLRTATIVIVPAYAIVRVGTRLIAISQPTVIQPAGATARVATSLRGSGTRIIPAAGYFGAQTHIVGSGAIALNASGAMTIWTIFNGTATLLDTTGGTINTRVKKVPVIETRVTEAVVWTVEVRKP